MQEWVIVGIYVLAAVTNVVTCVAVTRSSIRNRREWLKTEEETFKFDKRLCDLEIMLGRMLAARQKPPEHH